LNSEEVIKFIDYTLLDPHITDQEIEEFCNKARTYLPAAICIFPEKIRVAKKILGSEIPVAALVGSFPVGSNDCNEIKREIISAINLGADEIDIVIEPRDTDDYPNENELERLIAMRNTSKGKILKVIIETPLLNERKIRAITRMALATGVDFVKTCTGKRGSCSAEDVKIISYELMRHELTFNEKLGMKISGGIKDKKTVMEFIDIINKEDKNIILEKRFRIGTSSLIDKLLTTQ
jgi:deoxyribose-phosphate aldolase